MGGEGFTWMPYLQKERGRAGLSEILRSESYKCAFCNGSGQKPRGAICSVCRGDGCHAIDPPVKACAYCKGRGEERPRTNVTCTACRGRGFVSIQEPVETCSRCCGTGAEPTNKLVCIRCKGKGVVTVKG